jgi:hypothetical protein
MNFNQKFSLKFLPEQVNKLISKYIGDLSHLENVKTIGYLNSICVRGRNYKYRLQNTHNSEIFHSKDLLIKGFFRSFCDSIVTTDSVIHNHINNLEGIMIDFDSLGFFADPYLNNTYRQDKKKTYYILSSNPIINQIKENDFYKSEFNYKKILVLQKKYDKLPQNISSILTKQSGFEIIPIDNIELFNAISTAEKDGSRLTFIEGMGNKVVKYFNENNEQLNPIDYIVNSSIIFNNFSYYIHYKEKKEIKKLERQTNINNDKSEEEKSHEMAIKKSRIVQVGDIFDNENFEENYSLLNSVIVDFPEIDGSFKIDVYKKKGLYIPKMDENLKETMKVIKKNRNMKNKEKMRNLIRDN